MADKEETRQPDGIITFTATQYARKGVACAEY